MYVDNGTPRSTNLEEDRQSKELFFASQKQASTSQQTMPHFQGGHKGHKDFRNFSLSGS